MSLDGAAPCPILTVYSHIPYPFGSWSQSPRSGYASDASAGRSRAALISGIDSWMGKERWLLPHRRFYELMPPTLPTYALWGDGYGGTVGSELEKPLIQDHRRTLNLHNPSLRPGPQPDGADARLRLIALSAELR